MEARSAAVGKVSGGAASCVPKPAGAEGGADVMTHNSAVEKSEVNVCRGSTCARGRKWLD